MMSLKPIVAAMAIFGLQARRKDGPYESFDLADRLLIESERLGKA